MTKVELIAKVAAEADMTKKDAEKAVNATFVALADSLQAGEKIAVSGFGTFEVRERAEHKGRNPQTKEEIMIPASRTVAFKPGKALKDSL